MPNHTKSFAPNRRVAIGSRKKSKSKIWKNATKEYAKHQANMHHISLRDKQFLKTKNIGQSSAKTENNSVARGVSMSNHVIKRTSKGTKQPTASTAVGKAKLKEPHARRKGEVNNASQPTYLKAMPGLVQKTTDRQEKMVIDNGKENVRCGEYHKEGDTTKAKHTLDSTLLDIHGNSRSISSYPFGRDFLEFQRDNHSMNLTFQNVERIGLTEISMGQFANCNGNYSNSISKKRKELSFEENHKALDGNVGVEVDNMSCKQMKKLKQSRDCNGDLNHVDLEDDTASILKNDQAKVAMPSCVEQQCYSCSKPIDNPTWSGILKTDDKEYVSLNGHLSTKSCEKAWNLCGQLLKVVEVKKLLRLEVWPKAWEVSTPTGNDIGIYLFPHEMRQDEGFDQLVREVMQNDLALRAIIGEAEMLIFPSSILPNHHQTFQGKHYLWGVFKRREDKGVVAEEPLNVVGRCEMENQQNVVLDWPNHMLPGEEPNQEMFQMVSVIPLETHLLPPNKSTQEVEASHLKWPTNKGFDLKAHGEEGAHAKSTPVVAPFPASHEQVNPSMGHSTDRLVGFVVRKTPKLDRIIRELEEEGALVFAMQGEIVGAGSWVGSKATSTQK